MPHKILDAPCTSQVTGLLLQPGSRVEAIRWHLAGTMASLEEAARAFQPDILISVYYRKIIPQAILDIPPKVTYPNGSASGLRTRPHAACGRMRTARFAHLHTPFSCCSRCTEPEWLCGPTCQPHAAYGYVSSIRTRFAAPPICISQSETARACESVRVPYRCLSI